MPVDSDHPAGPLAVPRPADPGDPRWRVRLESRWRARLLEVTELSLAYHDAAAAPVPSTGPGDGGPAGGRHPAGGRQLRRLLNRAVTARRALADTEEALVRLAAGQFGRFSPCQPCADQVQSRCAGCGGRSRLSPPAHHISCMAAAPAPGYLVLSPWSAPPMSGPGRPTRET